MNLEKLVTELDSLIGSISKMHQKYEKTMRSFFTQLKEEEKSIRQKLKQEDSKASRKKLKKKLGMVKQAYGSLTV